MITLYFANEIVVMSFRFKFILFICISLSITCILLFYFAYSQSYIDEGMDFSFFRRQKEKGNEHNEFSCFRIDDKMNHRNSSLSLIQPFEDMGVRVATSIWKADMICFETLNMIDHNIKKLRLSPSSRCRWIMAVGGSDIIASKSMLCLTLRKAGLDHYIPQTYIFDANEDRQRFIETYDPNKLYILKKNVQRQEGIVILPSSSSSSTFDYVLDLFDKNAETNGSSFVVCQELLQDPLVVGGRKVNLRVYLLCCVFEQKGKGSLGEEKVQMYMYHDGFIYYTPEFWEPNSVSIDRNITTGYIDREVYRVNPLTLRDMITFLNQGKTDHLGDQLESSIIETMRKLASVYRPIFLQNQTKRNKQITNWTIFGCDLAPNSSCTNVKIMEVNKGPDLSYKDERDKALKFNMVKEALKIVGISNFETLEKGEKEKEKKGGDFIEL